MLKNIHIHKFLPWANTSEEMGRRVGFRTVLICPKCLKIKKIKKYIKAPIDYDVVLRYYAAVECGKKELENYLNHTNFLEQVVVDKQQYNDLFVRRDS